MKYFEFFSNKDIDGLESTFSDEIILKDTLWKMSAHEVVLLIRNGHLSPKEVVEASINRIEMVDETINALPIQCFERALNIAK